MIRSTVNAQAPLCLREHDFHALVAVAWAGPILTTQLWRLLGEPHSLRSVQRRLDRLEELGLLRKVRHVLGASSVDGMDRRGYVWIATIYAYEVLVGHEIEPPRRTPPSLHQLDHDLLGSEVLVHAVGWSRPLMSGVFFAREQYVDEHTAAPRIDAILIIRRGSLTPSAGFLPWLTAQAAPDEVGICFALEIDRGTEPYAVILEKGIAYRVASRKVAFRAPNPPFPIPLWVVPTASRLEGIVHQWRSAWPEGCWMITTEEDLLHDRWQLIGPRQRRTQSLLEGW